MNTRKLFLIPMIALCAAALVAGGGGKKKGKKAGVDPGYIAKGQRILVKDFTTDDVIVQGDHSRNEERVAAKKVRVPPMLTEKIISKLRERGYDAVPYSPESDAAGAIILDGEFQIMHNGSAAARAWVGFGSGQVWMLVKTWLYRPDDPSARIAETVLRGSSKIRVRMGAIEQPCVNVLANKLARHLAGAAKKKK